MKYKWVTAMKTIVLSGSGVYTPPFSISNEELVESFNRYVDIYNSLNHEDIEIGVVEPLLHSSADFIQKASGITSRYVLEKEGILDPERMCPQFEKRTMEQMSLQCEIGVEAAKEAMARAGKLPGDINGVIVSCSNYERPYPAIGIEIQQALGIDGFAFDMNVACSSATFAIQTAADSIYRGNCDAVLVVSPEICSGHLNFCDRDSHFIFGDVCTAVLVENGEKADGKHVFELVGTKLMTQYSTNIYNGSGFLDRTRKESLEEKELLFTQEGRRVFKEVVPLATDFINKHLIEHKINVDAIRRVWLHQANLNMNQLICKKLLGKDISSDVTPTILDRYANTASAGSVICFHHYHEDMVKDDIGVLCSFGAGYSVGNVILKKW